MLNHTYTSIHGNNTLDCGNHCHTSSAKQPLLKDNFLSEYKSEADKRRVIDNLGIPEIIPEILSFEWHDVK